jgi:hypothetical protein
MRQTNGEYKNDLGRLKDVKEGDRIVEDERG